MKIGQLAQRAGVGIDTVRYYERQGLLPEPLRQASGYRSYIPGDVARLQFVRRAKALGFTLEEIRDLLKATAMEKLTDVEAKLAELTRIRDGLQTLIDVCPGHGALERCPILNALVEEQP